MQKHTMLHANIVPPQTQHITHKQDITPPIAPPIAKDGPNNWK
jgi:hypothetical protein